MSFAQLVRHRHTAIPVFAAALTIAACSGSEAIPASPADGGLSDSGVDAGQQGAPDTGDPGADAGAVFDTGTARDTSVEASGPACTGTFGAGLTQAFGRLDGYLVAIVPVGGSRACNGDSSHVHLQVKWKTAIYDIAVNADGLNEAKDVAMGGGAWAEGWHTGAGVQNDYVQLGLHAADFVQDTLAVTAQKIEAALAQTSEISIFATGYGPDGAHLVHRNGSNNDGAIVPNPLSATPHMLFFRFSTQSF